VKLLFDQNISFRTVNLLRISFPDAAHVKDFDLQYSTDKEIWNFAKDNNFTIVTFDSDFNDIATLLGHPPKIIWIRTGNTSSKNLASLLSTHLDSIKIFIEDKLYKDVACLEIIKQG
jgi:predicted nuclease of predicted toxin-antitoxin system